VVTRVEIRPDPDGGKPTVLIDGTESTRDVRVVDRVGFPFAGMWIDGSPIFDAEVWTGDTLIHLIPARNEATGRVYEYLIARAPADRAGDFPDHDEADVLQAAVRRELETHPGWRAHDAWTVVRRMFTVHQMNFAQLDEILAAIANDFELAIGVASNVDALAGLRERVSADLDQRLHNYVASMGSLIDQTRRLIDSYTRMSIKEAYEARKGLLVSRPVTGFVRDLRNYLLHRSLPYISHSVSFNQESYEAKVLLSVAELNVWDGWKAEAKRFLASAGDDIELMSTVRDHFTGVDNLWRWLFAQYAGLHRVDETGYNELVNEHDWYLSGGQSGRLRRQWAILA
jgi:hypothetical protein